MFFSKCSSTQWLPVQQHVSEEFSSEVNSTKNRSHPPKKTEMWLNYTILDMYIIYIYRDCVVSLKYNTVYPQRPRINHQPPISHLARGCTICIQGVEERSWGAFEGADVFFFFFGMIGHGWMMDSEKGCWLWMMVLGWWLMMKRMYLLFVVFRFCWVFVVVFCWFIHFVVFWLFRGGREGIQGKRIGEDEHFFCARGSFNKSIQVVFYSTLAFLHWVVQPPSSAGNVRS